MDKNQCSLTVSTAYCWKEMDRVGNEVDEAVGSRFVRELVYPVEGFESLLFLEASLDRGGWSM